MCTTLRARIAPVSLLLMHMETDHVAVYYYVNAQGALGPARTDQYARVMTGSVAATLLVRT